MQAFTSWFFSFVTPYLYNVDSGNLGAKTGFVFTGTSILLFLGAWMLVPEIKDLGSVVLDTLYGKGVKPSEFEKVGLEMKRRREEVELKEFDSGGGGPRISALFVGEGRGDFGLQVDDNGRKHGVTSSSEI